MAHKKQIPCLAMEPPRWNRNSHQGHHFQTQLIKWSSQAMWTNWSDSSSRLLQRYIITTSPVLHATRPSSTSQKVSRSGSLALLIPTGPGSHLSAGYHGPSLFCRCFEFISHKSTGELLQKKCSGKMFILFIGPLWAINCRVMWVFFPVRMIRLF